ncbi:MAG: transporter [Ignavibacteriales bacterium]|nr:transporter [Ignavibacteriales bacterium]
MILRKQLLALLFFINAAFVYGGGFQINEHGARAMGMGGAFTAVAFDPSAVYFNAAAITNMSGFQMMVGTTLIAPSASFRGPYGPNTANPTVAESKMKSNMFFPSHAYLTYRVSEDLAVGFGFNNPFGLGTEWESDWVGRMISVKADVKTFSLTPVVAYRLFSGLSVAAGLQYNIGTVTLTKNGLVAANQQTPLGEAYVELEGEDMSAVGYTFSVLYKPTESFSVGANYRSEVKYDFTGTAKYKQLPPLTALPDYEKDVAASLTSPQQIALGLGYKLTSNLLLAADMQFVYWSSYDYMAIDFTEAGEVDPAPSPRLYKDTWIFRFGADYVYSDDLSLQCGLLYDKNPVQDRYIEASLPDADRLGYSVGASYKLSSNLSTEFAYLFLSFKERTITDSEVSSYSNPAPGVYMPEKFNGTYNFHAHLASISLKYQF